MTPQLKDQEPSYLYPTFTATIYREALDEDNFLCKQELQIEIEYVIYPAEPDVGIHSSYIEDWWTVEKDLVLSKEETRKIEQQLQQELYS